MVSMVNAFRARVLSGIVLIFFLTGLNLVGCRQRIKGTDPEPDGRYRAILKQWTREGRSYAGLDLQLLVAATYQSRAFGAAYVSEYSKIHQLDASETKQMAEAQEQTARRYYQFLIAAYVYEKRLDNFGETDSSWNIYLTVGDDKRLVPAEIEKTKYADPKIRHFFPYVTPWKTAYIVRFPKSGSDAGDGIAGSIRLDITGVAGRVEMVW